MSNVKEKKKIRFNLVDFFIIISVLLAVLMIVFRGTVADFVGNVVYTDEATVSFTVKGVSKGDLEMIKKDDTVYYDEKTLGKVLSVEYVNSTVNVIDDSSGTPVYKQAVDYESYDLKITVSTVGAFFEDGFYFDGQIYLGVGKNLELYTDNYSCFAIITAIT